MGTGFESWDEFHAVEGNNKTLITPKLVQFLNTHYLISSVSGPILLQNDSKKIGTRALKKNVKINIPFYHPKNVFQSEENISGNMLFVRQRSGWIGGCISQMIDRSTQ